MPESVFSYPYFNYNCISLLSVTVGFLPCLWPWPIGRATNTFSFRHYWKTHCVNWPVSSTPQPFAISAFKKALFWTHKAQRWTMVTRKYATVAVWQRHYWNPSNLADESLHRSQPLLSVRCGYKLFTAFYRLLGLSVWYHFRVTGLGATVDYSLLSLYQQYCYRNHNNTL